MSARLVKNLINRIRNTEISQNNEFDEKRSAQQWRACLRALFESDSGSDRPEIATWLGQLIDDFHHIGPDRPLPPRSECLGFPPRHVRAAERCFLLTY